MEKTIADVQRQVYQQQPVLIWWVQQCIHQTKATYVCDSLRSPSQKKWLWMKINKSEIRLMIT